MLDSDLQDSYRQDSQILYPKFDYFFRLIIIGDSGVGKTTLMKRFTLGEYRENYISTIGADSATAYRDINNKKVKLQICDTAGQERFKSITSSYYTNSDGVIIVYDCTNLNSFKNIRYWYNEVNRLCRDNVQIVLVSTKNDCESVVDKAQVDEFCEEFGIKFIETSSKSGVGVDIMFNYLTLKIYGLMKPDPKIEEEESEDKYYKYYNKGKTIAIKLNDKINDKIKNNECC